MNFVVCVVYLFTITPASSLFRNHPIIKDDGLLAVFLTEPSLEAWRKHSSVSLEEESHNKKVDRVEEMSIPSDLEEKLS
jgi:sorting nexin-8